MELGSAKGTREEAGTHRQREVLQSIVILRPRLLLPFFTYPSRAEPAAAAFPSTTGLWVSSFPTLTTPAGSAPALGRASVTYQQLLDSISSHLPFSFFFPSLFYLGPVPAQESEKTNRRQTDMIPTTPMVRWILALSFLAMTVAVGLFAM